MRRVKLSIVHLVFDSLLRQLNALHVLLELVVVLFDFLVKFFELVPARSRKIPISQHGKLAYITLIVIELFIDVLRRLFFVCLPEEFGRCNIRPLDSWLHFAAEIAIIHVGHILSGHARHPLLFDLLASAISVLKFICAALAVRDIVDLRFAKEVVAEQIWHAGRGGRVGFVCLVEFAGWSCVSTGTVSVRVLLRWQ